MKRSFKDYALLALKGMGMGAADVVPGVSGGTIAFIVGIYDELIDSIKSINAQSLKMFFTGKWGTFWKMINGNFLLFLLAGIGELLEKEPDLLQRLPLGSIATYLGVTQASLSRIRAKITRP